MNTTGGAATPHISGSRNANNEQQIDGISNVVPSNNVGTTGTAYTPIVDSVQEFSIQTSVASAEYGRFEGGVTNLSTKSGTNKFHGSGFIFARNAVLDAKTYFSLPTQPKTDSARYQYGGTFGGPIYRDRTFFFIGFEGARYRTATTSTFSVPLVPWRTGDFSTLPTPIYDPTTVTPVTTSTGTTYQRQQFAGNIIPANRLNPVALKAIAFYPLPNTGAAGQLLNNYTATGLNAENYYKGDARVDHQFTQNWRSFARFSKYQDNYTPLNPYGNAAAPNGDGPTLSTAISAVIDNIVTFKPNLIGDFRYGLSRATTDRTAYGQGFDLTSIGLPASYQAVASQNRLIFPTMYQSNGYSALGGQGYVPYISYPTSHDATASLTYVKGANTLKVGGEFRKLLLNYYQYSFPSGQFSFDRNFTQKTVNAADGSGSSFASMMLGLPTSGSMTHEPTASTASSYIAAYVQDDWRVTPHLTLNLGLRWDGEIPRSDRYNRMTYWDPTQVSTLGASVSSVASCPSCSNLKGQMEFVNTPGARYGRHQGPFQNKNFAPRVGFSYSPDSKTAIRGGFGLAFAPSPLQAAGTTGGLGNDGFSTSTNFAFSYDSTRTINTTLSDPAKAGYTLPSGAALGGAQNLGQAIGYSYFPSYRNPYTEQANLNVQRELPGQMLVEAGYVYAHGMFLIDGDPGTPLNQAPTSYLSLGNSLYDTVPNPFYGKITTAGSTLSQPTVQRNQLLRPFPQYLNVTSMRKPGAASIYNSFTFRLDKRFSNNFALLVAFTGAKLMDNSSASVTFVGPTSGTRADQYNPLNEWSLSTQDIARNLVVNGTLELPFGRGHRFLSNAPGVVNTMIQGWQGSGIVSYNTGTPVVLAAAINQTGIFTLNQRPNQLIPNTAISGRNRNKWFNTAGFAQPAPFTIGNAKRVISNVRAPGVMNADLALLKNNYLGHDRRFNAQFRFELFNAFNHVRFSAPNADVNSANFGRITSQANTSRQIQLAAKFVF